MAPWGLEEESLIAWHSHVHDAGRVPPPVWASGDTCMVDLDNLAAHKESRMMSEADRVWRETPLRCYD